MSFKIWKWHSTTKKRTMLHFLFVCLKKLIIRWLSLGSEECPFPYPSDGRRDWSPESPIMPARVHSYTQTEGPQLSSMAPEASRLQSSLLIPVPPILPSCPSPVPLRKQRYCAKWENRASVLQKPKESVEESKCTYESLEYVSTKFLPHRL